MHRQAVPRARLTTNIVGGLGNQLFLVANLLATARRCGVPAVLPRTTFSSSSEAPRPTYWDSVFGRLAELGVHMVDERDEVFRQEVERDTVVVPDRRPVAPVRVDPQRDCLYNLVGFFQSEGFFCDYPAIRDVVPTQLHSLAADRLRDSYGDGSDDTHFVALHLRRGDYVRLPDVFAQLSLRDYYDVAVRQLLGGRLLRSGGGSSAVALLVFCEEDDAAAEACDYFAKRYSGVRVAHVHHRHEMACAAASGGAPPSHPPREVLELLMMAHCGDVVMANSTFSWWGAYLNQRPLHRVVAPSRWFVQHPYPHSNHLYCDNWLLL